MTDLRGVECALLQPARRPTSRCWMNGPSG